MPKRLRPIGYDDRLSVVDHLDELRSRLFVCLGVLVVAFGFCFWQSGFLERTLNKPLQHLSKQTRNHLNDVSEDEVGLRKYLLSSAGDAALLARSSTQSAQDRLAFAALAKNLSLGAQQLPKTSAGVTPVTTGVGEPFTVSLEVAVYAALLISLPVLLYELFAFVVPALTARERRVITPILIAAPGLFLLGVVFTYIIVLPAAIRFLQGYNSNQFQALIQAQPLYSFEALTMAGIGLAFEMPIILLGLQVAGLINGNTLTKHWRYAVVILAIIGAAMPGSDPVTTGLEMLPLAILFVVSIFLLKFVDRRAAAAAAEEAATGVGGLSTGP